MVDYLIWDIFQEMKLINNMPTHFKRMENIIKI